MGLFGTSTKGTEDDKEQSKVKFHTQTTQMTMSARSSAWPIAQCITISNKISTFFFFNFETKNNCKKNIRQKH